MKRIDSYAELSSHSARICQYKSTYITFKYSEEINFLYGRCVLERHAAVAGLSPLSAASSFKRTLARRTRPGSADAEAHTPRYTAQKWSYVQYYKHISWMRRSETLGCSKHWHVHSGIYSLLGSTGVGHISRYAAANMILCRALLAYLVVLRKKKSINHRPVTKNFMCTVAFAYVKNLR